MVTIFNTLTRAKEEIKSSRPDGKIRMYECGLTVYDEPHIGHARTAIVFDTLKRWLVFRGMPVIHVRNVTDIEDKIIKRANERGISTSDLVARYDGIRKELFARLNLLPPDFEPYATAHIKEIIALVEKLLASGLAYASGGDVYYRVRKFAGYGKLSGNTLEDLVAGARNMPGERKEDPLDFDLWKAAKPDEPSWDSPWGKGRPGWHIECSAMSMKYLGDTLDIHGGANDLVFPHHENEIAQSEGATGRQFVRIWVHSGWVTMNQEKMSKSLGNTISLREVVDRVPAPALRLLMGQTHYRSPLEYSEAQERQAVETYKGIILRYQIEDEVKGSVIENSNNYTAPSGNIVLDADGGNLYLNVLIAHIRNDYFTNGFDKNMDDDLGTPRAIASLSSAGYMFREFIRENPAYLNDPFLVRRLVSLRDEILSKYSLLGIEVEIQHLLIPNDVQFLLDQRQQARKNREWNKSDMIREAIRKLGWDIEDRRDGFRIRRIAQ